MTEPIQALVIEDIGRTNCIHSDREKRIIRELILGEKGTLLACRTKAEKDEINERLRRYKVALAPHKLLSEDVLSYIFELCCEEPASFPIIRESDVRLILTQVCSAWREIMLNTPSIWNDVLVNMSEVSEGAYPGIVQIASKWLNRAQNVPVEMTLRYHQFSSRGSTTDIVKQLIAPYKFRSLVLDVCVPQMLEVLALPEECLSSCTDLRFYNSSCGSIGDGVCIDGVIDESDRDLILDFKLFPNLEVLQLHMSRWKIRSIPFHRLRHYSVEAPMKLSICWDILKHGSTTLEGCELEISKGNAAELNEVIRCPNIQDFSVHFDSRVRCIESFFMHLELPKLESLSISGHVTESELLMVGEWLRSSDILLKRLSFDHYHNVPVSLRSLLQSMPSLHRLELDGDIILDSAIIHDLSTGALGRHLAFLQLSEIPGQLLSEFLDMVKMRSDCGTTDGSKIARFERVWFDCFSLPTGPDRLPIEDIAEEVRQQGVDIQYQVEFG